MAEAFICDGIRTPIGRYSGSLANVRPDDLAAKVLAELKARNPQVDFAAVDDIILGCANQAGEDNRNVARMAALLSGIGDGVPVEVLDQVEAPGVGMDQAHRRERQRAGRVERSLRSETISAACTGRA